MRSKPDIPDKPAVKARLFAKARGCCEYCGIPLRLEEATLDHWQARSRGCSHVDLNLRIACCICNRAKANLPPNAFLAWLDQVARNRHPHRKAFMKASIGRGVTVIGIESNGAHQHPATITRAWSDFDTIGGPVAINVTVFPDAALPQVHTSVQLFETRDEAEAHRAANDGGLAAFWPERV